MNRRRLRLSCGFSSSILWIALAALAPVRAQPIVPLGEEVRLPLPPAACPHSAPTVAWFPDGGLLAVWDRGDSGIVGRFAPDAGLALGPEVALSGGDFRPAGPALAAVSDEGFLAAWLRGPTEDREIVLQRFDRVGVAASPRSVVAAHRRFWSGPAIDVSPAGRAIVAWSELDTADDLARVAFRLYTPGAEPLTGELVAAATAIGPGPADRVFFAEVGLAAGSDGGFLISWTRFVSVPSYTHEVMARGFDRDGDPRGAAAVSLSPPEVDRPPGLAVAPLPGGGFLVGWASPETDGGIFVRGVDPAAQPVAEAIRVDEPGGGAIVSGPRLAVDGPGFVIAWERRAPGLQVNAYGRRLDGRGEPRSEELAINRPVEETWGSGFHLTGLTLDASAGRLAAAWQIWWESPILPTECDLGVSTVARTFSTRGADPTAIPTLSGLGHAALALLLAVAGLWAFARRRLAARRR